MITLTDDMKKRGWRTDHNNSLSRHDPVLGGDFKIRLFDGLYDLFYGDGWNGYKRVKLFDNLDDALTLGERDENHESVNGKLLTLMG